MKEEKFRELLQSVEEMGQIIHGEIKPARVSTTVVEPEPDLATYRGKPGTDAALPGLPADQQTRKDRKERY